MFTNILKKRSVYFVTELFTGVILLLVERICKWVVDYRYNMIPMLIGRDPDVGTALCSAENS